MHKNLESFPAEHVKEESNEILRCFLLAENRGNEKF